MNTKLKIQSIVVLILGALLSIFNACSPAFQSATNLSSIDPGNDTFPVSPSLSISETAFSKSLHPLLLNNCASCHGVNQHPKFAVSDVKQAHQTLMDRNLVSLNKPEGSYLIEKLQTGHNGFSPSLVNDFRAKIQNWAQAMNIDTDEPDPSPPSDGFENSGASSILNKIKFLAHGGPLSESEWKTYASETNNLVKMRTLVNSWIDSDEGKAKIKFYLTNALNQDFVADSESESVNGVASKSGPGSAVEKNMKESFARTALDLIERNRPFYEIATTKRFSVTTALLSSYAYMDRRDGKSPRFINLFREQGITTDYNDWRFVTFEQSDEAPRLYTELAHFRSIPNNATVRFGIPRVGYFSTPAFLGKYPSNFDNQFRVTINQTLIAGLGRTFSPSDTTNQPQLVHMDRDHADDKTDCFQCHRIMDPMREIFGNKMQYDYKFNNKFSDQVSSFAFYKYIKPLSKLNDLGNAIGSHPEFPAAWVQKLCIAFNTTKCLESDPEFIRLANLFKSESYNFKTLYRELLLSSLVTGSKSTQTAKTLGFEVARTRQFHLCHNMNVRQILIQQKRGIAPSPFDAGDTICKNNNALDSIGNDHTIRGTTDVINSFPTDAIARQGIERTCKIMAEAIIKGKKTLSHDKVSTLNESADLITEIVAGLPPSHPRHSAFKSALLTIHDHNTKNLSMTYSSSLTELLTFACTSPDFIGVGL